MNIKDFPNEKKEILDIVAKAGCIKSENDNVAVSLESATTINIQPKGTIFGAKIKVEENGSVTPTLTFDTKKLKEEGTFTSPKKALDTALENFFNNQNV